MQEKKCRDMLKNFKTPYRVGIALVLGVAEYRKVWAVNIIGTQKPVSHIWRCGTRSDIIAPPISVLVEHSPFPAEPCFKSVPKSALDQLSNVLICNRMSPPNSARLSPHFARNPMFKQKTIPPIDTGLYMAIQYSFQLLRKYYVRPLTSWSQLIHVFKCSCFCCCFLSVPQ